MATQQELALQMLAQLRALDPSVSAEVGTPERKILDTVAQALSDAQIDLVQLSGALDIDSKIGTNLDNFLALFGFGRQQAIKATGFVTLGRTSASTQNIRIPSGTQLIASNVQRSANDAPINVIFETTFETTLLAGELSVVVPIRAILPGTVGNIAANQISGFASAAVYGIQTFANEAAITGGIDVEDDDQVKVRFKNTVFRNLAGTQDQYIALAASAAFTTKVNVIGPISRYREYIQVPFDDDTLSGSVGVAGNYTTALSTVPYSKHIYTTVPTFISNGNVGTQTVFWREEIDWILNTDASVKNHGDASRQYNNGLDVDPTGVAATYRPNVTFNNVYTGPNASVTAVRNGDTVLLEHSYLSTASRNDFVRNVTNCVDVFINGSNDTTASTIVPAPGTSIAHTFVMGPDTSKYSVNNYRLAGEPNVMPTTGWIFIPLFWQPVTSLPDEIIISNNTDTAIYFLNEHYYLVEDITDLNGTIRARNGLAWNPNANGALTASDVARTGLALNDWPVGTPIEINNYSYDKNVVDLQSNLEAAKQVTTDVLVHRSRTRWFKLDVSVMYVPGANTLQTNDAIRTAVDTFLKDQYFGNVIQQSDLLATIHSVTGVDNVRWSSDIPGSDDLHRIFETNEFGTTLLDDSANPIVFNSDFFMQDDELPRLSESLSSEDTLASASREFMAVPGLIIRSRAQNTWTKA